MKSVDSESEPSNDSVPAKARLQFSLLGYLTVTTLISLAIGPALHILRSQELVVYAVFAMAICGLAGTAHFFANWILTPCDRRTGFYATGWFWSFAGFAFLLCGLHDVAYLLDFSQSGVRGMRLPFWLLDRVLLFATGVSFVASWFFRRRNHSAKNRVDVNSNEI